MKDKLAYILFIVFLYLWLFSPAFGIFRGIFVVSNVIVLVGIIMCFLKNNIFIEFYNKFKSEFYWLLYFFVLSIFLIAFDFQTKVATQHLLMMVDLFCVTPLLFEYARKKGFAKEEYIVRALLILGVIATFFTIMCIVSPSFNEYVKFTLIKYERSSFLFDADFRGFGFANGLTGDYGFILGFIACLGFFYLKKNQWFLIFIPFIVLSILVNARTGIFITLVGLVCLFFQKKNIVGSIIALAFVFIFANYWESILTLLNVNDKTINWINTFGYEMNDVITEGDLSGSNTVETLFRRMIVFPDDSLQWLIGRGYELFGNEHGVRHSDIGWVNQLNYGGLIYFIPLLFFFFKIFKKMTKNKGLGFGLFVLSAIIISNTKGRLFPSYSLFTIIMMLYFVTSPKLWNNKELKK